eukprot:superscaffoldBa00003274_g16531
MENGESRYGPSRDKPFPWNPSQFARQAFKPVDEQPCISLGGVATVPTTSRACPAALVDGPAQAAVLTNSQAILFLPSLSLQPSLHFGLHFGLHLGLLVSSLSLPLSRLASCLIMPLQRKLQLWREICIQSKWFTDRTWGRHLYTRCETSLKALENNLQSSPSATESLLHSATESLLASTTKTPLVPSFQLKHQPKQPPQPPDPKLQQSSVPAGPQQSSVSELHSLPLLHPASTCSQIFWCWPPFLAYAFVALWFRSLVPSTLATRLSAATPLVPRALAALLSATFLVPHALAPCPSSAPLVSCAPVTHPSTVFLATCALSWPVDCH